MITQAKIFQVNPIPDSFDTLYDEVVAAENDNYYHWCGEIAGNLLANPTTNKTLTENEFEWVGDYTGYLATFGGDHK